MHLVSIPRALIPHIRSHRKIEEQDELDYWMPSTVSGTLTDANSVWGDLESTRHARALHNRMPEPCPTVTLSSARPSMPSVALQVLVTEDCHNALKSEHILYPFIVSMLKIHCRPISLAMNTKSYHCCHVKLRDANDSFGFFTSIGTLPLQAPFDYIQSARPSDLFVHRVISDDVAYDRRLQIWMLTQCASEELPKTIWEPVAIGTSRFFSGTERRLGVDPSTGRPYWYLVESFARYTMRHAIA